MLIAGRGYKMECPVHALGAIAIACVGIEARGHPKVVMPTILSGVVAKNSRREPDGSPMSLATRV